MQNVKEKKKLPPSLKAPSSINLSLSYAKKKTKKNVLTNLGGKQSVLPNGALGVGDLCELKITALGPNGVGIDEFSYGYSILIPNAKLGETVKAKIIKINLKKAKYAIAKKASLLSGSKSEKSPSLSLEIADEKTKAKQNFHVGDILTVKLNSIALQTNNTCIGIVNTDEKLPKQYKLIIPLNSGAKVGDKIKIRVTRIKLNYGFAQVVSPESLSPQIKITNQLLDLGCFAKPKAARSAPTENSNTKSTSAPKVAFPGGVPFAFFPYGEKAKQSGKGSKITLTLPLTAKNYAKHIVIRLKPFPPTSPGENGWGASLRKKGMVFFIKNLLGAKLGDKVRVKVIKIGYSPSGERPFAIGKVIRIAPISTVKKLLLARKSVNEMLSNGMHYGEKVVKCQAKMINYIWNRKKGQNKNRPLIKKGRHLINLLKTRRCLNIGLNQLTKYAAKGRTFLFVGTKKPAAGLIARAALFTKTSFFVNTRWLGGMLTNWKTIIKSISKIRPILKEKQKVISNILQKRAKIQNRLIKKVLSLRKKSHILIKKGKKLIEKVKISFPSLALDPSSKTDLRGSAVQQKLNIKRKELFDRGQLLLQTRENLLKKQNGLKQNTLDIKKTGFFIKNKYQVLLNKLTTTHQKLHEIRLFFLLNKELRHIQKLAQKQGKKKFTLSSTSLNNLLELSQNSDSNLIPLVLDSPSLPQMEDAHSKTNQVRGQKTWLIPNPPQEILNKILMIINDISNYSSINETGNGGAPSPWGASLGGIRKGTAKQKKTEGLPSSHNQSIILTKLLSKFSRFLPYIKKSLSILLNIITGIEKKITTAELFVKTNLPNLKKKLIRHVELNNKINAELKLIKTKYTSIQQIIRVLRRKLKRHEAEKKLLQFLPKLRYLPTPKSQISLAIQILMKRFVDPKMKYPMDLIYDEKLRKKSKKVAAARKKKWQRLETYFGGISNMTKLKKTQISNNVAIIIGQQEEMNAVRECQKLGIKMFHIVDTNCNPGLADHYIPSNDDSRNSIKYLLTKIITRIRLAQKMRLRFKRA